MQQKYDKRLIAADMLEEAINKFKMAKTDLDYIQSILLAGASIGITNPLLSEKQKQTAHEKSAESVIRIREYSLGRKLSQPEREDVFSGALRFNKQAYNSLKHAGKGKKLAASKDLEIETDFAVEAEELLWAAIEDFNNLPISPEFLIEHGKNNFRLLIGQSDPLDTMPKMHCKPRSNT
ncbi:hypothetical protein ACUULL_003544 [Vibrio cholerae]|uniref:hypothetical protein n=1 Tax=Vibrio cholerae TaxID=666 RepID=UPI000BA96FF5|nr:hypothetical protein [Vibrio cholerae]MCU8474417.1 hypothetical protein [Vibrio vulnificus]EJL6492804.1 hypothetical protein [Vibrio cholerae]EJL6644940.1 hypothetical protein [Vibrio cholerae]ELT6289861.1 hypothetical protein [Vibrio cholerae]PAS34251.1 hypothetical protein CGT70_18565 [Vibrio cholerae]